MNSLLRWAEGRLCVANNLHVPDATTSANHALERSATSHVHGTTPLPVAHTRTDFARVCWTRCSIPGFASKAWRTLWVSVTVGAAANFKMLHHETEVADTSHRSTAFSALSGMTITICTTVRF